MITMALKPGKSPEWLSNAKRIETATPRMLTLGEVAKRTGLRPEAIMVAVLSRAHSGPRAKMRALYRPRWVVGANEPRWAQEQVDEYFRTVEEIGRGNQMWAHLPEVTSGEARRAQLAMFAEISRASGIPKTTLDRWKNIDGFPLPVAAMNVGSPNRRKLYVWRQTDSLLPVLKTALGRTHGVIDERWLMDKVFTQLTVGQWLEQHNPQWLKDHPDTDLTVSVHPT